MFVSIESISAGAESKAPGRALQETLINYGHGLRIVCTQLSLAGNDVI